MDKKKLLNGISAGVIAAGTIGFVLTGGTEGTAGTIVAVAVGLVGAITAVINVIKG